MTNQTSDRGRRLEDLYEACMELPPGGREAFIQTHAAGDPEMADRLRSMIRLENPGDAGMTPPVAGEHANDRFEFEPGTVFGKCRIVSGHDAGAMGAVYLALDLENHNRRVAVKVMKPALLSDDHLRRFTNETAAHSRLVHPNIVQLYFWGIESWQGVDRPYFVMEYVDGQTLDRHRIENKLTVRQKLELLRKICRAVHHGHLKGVFHRDLKPSNILVTRDGEPKIIDFGVSFMTGIDPGTDNGDGLSQNVGTLQYMAPEVAAGRPYSPDPRTDVYSVGVIAFELFAGRRPGVLLPSGEVEQLVPPLKVNQIRGRIAGCERERLRRVRPFDGDLPHVIATALRLDIDRRYADAGELAEDFRRLAALETVNCRPRSTRSSAKMFALRNRIAVTAVAAIFAVILGSAVALAIGESRVKTALGVIERKNAEAHFRAANLAEQRGKWTIAVDEYRAAESGGYPDALAVEAGQLRALGRSDRFAETDALIARVHQTMPAVAGSPRFQVVEGFVYWSSKPDQSLRIVKQALAHCDQLSPADRAFAEALTGDDVRVVAARLRETVDADPFNRDAWALLGLCDLALGDARRCEQDESLLRRLYPDDGVGAVLCAVAAAFQGRHSAAIDYLDDCRQLPPDLKAELSDTIDLACRTHSFDDATGIPLYSVIKMIPGVFTTAGRLTASHRPPIPVTFGRISSYSSLFKLVALAADPMKRLKAAAEWPNGDGEFAAATIATLSGDFAGAIPHYRAATTEPGLIDCHRRAAAGLANARAHDCVKRNLSEADAGALLKPDLEQLISFGGVFPDKFADETAIVQEAAYYRCFPQVRTLSLLWLSRMPDDARAMYYLADADWHLGDPDTAQSLFKRALAGTLPDEMKTDARKRLASTMPAPEAGR